MNKRVERRGLRRRIGQYSWALLIYYFLLNFIVSVVIEIDLIRAGFRAVIEGNRWDAFYEGIGESAERVAYGNGWGYLIACAAAVTLIRVWKGKNFFHSIFQTKRDMNRHDFWSLLCLFLGGQLLFQVIALVEELIANLLGLTVLGSIELASGGVDTFSMFLYMGLAAPVVEEVVFRGLILRGLEPYGKRFAVFASALLFGAFHGNLVQSPYAFAVGLVLGYVALEYSVLWAMVLHMMNNLFLGDSLVRLTAWMSAGWSDLLFLGINLLCGIGSVVILIRNRRAITAYRRSDPIPRASLRGFFTAPATILVLILTLVSAVSLLLV